LVSTVKTYEAIRIIKIEDAGKRVPEIGKKERYMPVVSIVRSKGRSVEDAVRDAVKLAGGLPERIKPGANVLIKPNVVQPIESGSGIITDSRVTEAVAKLVLEQNPDRIIVGEGASVGYDVPDFRNTMEAFKLSGTAEVAERLGVELVDLNRDTTVEVEAAGAFVMRKFRVAKTAMDADVIVSVPVLKTHIRTGVTASLKNMKGVLPGLEKRRTHRSGLDRAIVDLNRVVRPDFAVVDAINCMEGTWTVPEDRVELNLVIAGADPVAVDSVCAKVIGLDPDRIMHIKLAEEEGLGVANLERIEVVGEKIEGVAKRFRSYREAFTERFKGVRIVEKDACTGCMGEAVSTLIYLRSAGFNKEMEELTLVLGSPETVPRLNAKPVIVGQCASKHKGLGVYVPGCPPHGFDITDGACEALGIDKEAVRKAVEELHKIPKNEPGDVV